MKIEVRISIIVSFIECIIKKVMIHSIDASLVRVIKCVTFVINLVYERIDIAWARYRTNFIKFYIYLINSNVRVIWVRNFYKIEQVFEVDTYNYV